MVSVIEPTLTSHRSFHEPAVITPHFCGWSSGSTPSRLAISVATSTSKPFHSPDCTSYHDCGLYFGSVATRSVPLSHTLASASPAEVSALAHTVFSIDPVEPVSPLAVLLSLSSLHAAATSM